MQRWSAKSGGVWQSTGHVTGKWCDTRGLGAPELAQRWRGGPGNRRKDVWRVDLLREAVGTAVWAYRIGDERFESQGHRMLQQALELF